MSEPQLNCNSKSEGDQLNEEQPSSTVGEHVYEDSPASISFVTIEDRPTSRGQAEKALPTVSTTPSLLEVRSPSIVKKTSSSRPNRIAKRSNSTGAVAKQGLRKACSTGIRHTARTWGRNRLSNKDSMPHLNSANLTRVAAPR